MTRGGRSAEPPRVPDVSRTLRTFSLVHSGILVAAGAAALGLERALIEPAAGTASVVAFFVLAVPRAHALGLANLVTLLRSGLLVSCVALDSFHGALTALGAFASLVLDGVDGWLARRRGTSSAFGAQLDVETDSLLVATLAVAATLEGHGAWSLLAGALRPVYVLARASVRGVEIPERRSPWGRRIFVASSCLLMASLVVPHELGARLATATACALLCVSFAPDFGALRRARTRLSPL